MADIQHLHALDRVHEIRLEAIAPDTFRAIVFGREDGARCIIDIREVCVKGRGAIQALSGLPDRAAGIGVTAAWEFDQGKNICVNSCIRAAIRQASV